MMPLKKCLIISSLILALSNCSIPPFEKDPEVVVRTEYVDRKIPIVARPRPVQLSSPEFFVVTSENFDEFIEEFYQKNGTTTYVAISVEGYEQLSLNVAELRRFINQQKEIIVYYENQASR